MTEDSVNGQANSGQSRGAASHPMADCAEKAVEQIDTEIEELKCQADSWLKRAVCILVVGAVLIGAEIWILEKFARYGSTEFWHMMALRGSLVVPTLALTVWGVAFALGSHRVAKNSELISRQRRVCAVALQHLYLQLERYRTHVGPQYGQDMKSVQEVSFQLARGVFERAPTGYLGKGQFESTLLATVVDAMRVAREDGKAK